MDIGSNIANIKNNFFSGLINTTMNDSNYTISAIGKSNIIPITTLNNYCLFTSTTFKCNGSSFSKYSLGDYLISSYFTTFCDTNSSYLDKFSLVFAEWKNPTTFTPSLV